MRQIRQILRTLFMAAVIVTAFGACQVKGEAQEVNIREKLDSLIATEEDLGVAGKYETLADITDGSVDPDLVGTWASADGTIIIAFDENGNTSAEYTDYYMTSENRFTCLASGDKKIICEEVDSVSYTDEEEVEETRVMTYMVYSVENDALYLVSAEAKDDIGTQYVANFMMLYKTDESGSNAAAIAANPIALSSISGEWTADEGGSISINENSLSAGDDVFALSFDEKNHLVAEKDGTSTAYNLALGYMKRYSTEDRTALEGESYALSLTYTGADENDVPNLKDHLIDWKTEYEWETWYYTGNYERPKE